MGLRKGMTNNVNGRPVGSKNKFENEHRVFMKDFVLDFHNSGQFKKVFGKLTPSEKMKVLMDMMQYVTPKLQSVSNELTFGEQMPKIIITPAPDYEPIKESENESNNKVL
jgi:hypothetical protein